MVCKVFFVALLFLYLVTQIHAYEWKGKEDLIADLGNHYLEPEGLDVTSSALSDANRTRICLLGAEDGALMYETEAVNITDHAPTKIKVKIPVVAEYQGVSYTAISEDEMLVIPCASNISEHIMKKFFFGRGPIAKSIAVYAQDLNVENAVAECYGMFTNVFGWQNPQ